MSGMYGAGVPVGAVATQEQPAAQTGMSPAAQTGMESDFSYERDVAPYAGRFFGQIQQDTRLSPAARQRLQSGLLSGVSAIESQRMKLQEERDQSVMRRLQAERSMLEMEELRSKNARRQSLLQQGSTLDSELDSVVRSAEDAATRKQKLADLQYKYADLASLDPAIARKFDIADQAIPKPKEYTGKLTAGQQMEAAAKYIDPNLIAAVDAGAEDPAVLGYAMAQAEQKEKSNLAKLEESKKLASENKAYRERLLEKEIKFADPRDTGEDNIMDAEGRIVGTRRWLTDESQIAAKQIAMLGTPEEQAAFNAAVNDDNARYRIVQDIRIRELQKRLSNSKAGTGGVNASSFTGR